MWKDIFTTLDTNSSPGTKDSSLLHQARQCHHHLGGGPGNPVSQAKQCEVPDLELSSTIGICHRQVSPELGRKRGARGAGWPSTATERPAPPQEMGCRGGRAAKPGLPGAADLYALPAGHSAVLAGVRSALAGTTCFPTYRPSRPTSAHQRAPDGGAQIRVCGAARRGRRFPTGRPGKSAVPCGSWSGGRGPGAVHGQSAASTRLRASRLGQGAPGTMLCAKSSPHSEWPSLPCQHPLGVGGGWGEAGSLPALPWVPQLQFSDAASHNSTQLVSWGGFTQPQHQAPP